MRYVLAYGLLVCAPAYAAGVHKPVTDLQYSCATVRVAVAMFSTEHLEALAKAHGIVITDKMRREVAECLRGG
jgi:hypothetical protein